MKTLTGLPLQKSHEDGEETRRERETRPSLNASILHEQTNVTHLTYVCLGCLFYRTWAVGLSVSSICSLWPVSAVAVSERYRYPALRTNERTHGRAGIISKPSATRYRETCVTVRQTRPFPSWKPSARKPFTD